MMEFRNELKIRLTNHNFSKAWTHCERVFFPEEIYQQRAVNSVYLDDPHFTSLKDNISGISDRKKFRIRWYGTEWLDQRGILNFEVKVKKNKVGSKINLPLNNRIENFFDKNLGLNMKELYLACAADFFSCEVPFQLSPAVLITYSRRYFKSGSIIITLDKDLRVANAQLSKKVSEHTFRPINVNIIEFKFDKVHAEEFRAKSQDSNLIFTRCSKYVLAHAELNNVLYI